MEVYCDPASLTSVQLLKVLLAERGLRPEFKPLPSYDFSRLPDYALLIGDNALDLALGPHEHEIWDLAAAWYELTKLPFVFAVWALRREVENSRLRRLLRDIAEGRALAKDALHLRAPWVDWSGVFAGPASTPAAGERKARRSGAARPSGKGVPRPHPDDAAILPGG